LKGLLEAMPDKEQQRSRSQEQTCADSGCLEERWKRIDKVLGNASGWDKRETHDVLSLVHGAAA
jgi:hypothetical protein